MGSLQVPATIVGRMEVETLGVGSVRFGAGPLWKLPAAPIEVRRPGSFSRGKPTYVKGDTTSDPKYLNSEVSIRR